MRSVLFIFTLFFSLLSTGAYAQQRELKPAAQAPFDQGVAAAKQQKWQEAIQALNVAYQADPDAPQIWFNLGLAESKVSGHELRASAWLGGYLAASPQAANAAAVKEAIERLQVRATENIVTLIKSAESMAKLTPDVPKDVLKRDYIGNAKPDAARVGALWEVSNYWAYAGRNDDALRVMRRICESGCNELTVLSELGGRQAMAGDLEAARRTAASLPRGAGRPGEYEYALDSIQRGVALTQARVGAFAEARQTISLIKEPSLKREAEQGLAASQQALSQQPCPRRGSTGDFYFVPPACAPSLDVWKSQLGIMESPLFANLSEAVTSPEAALHAVYGATTFKKTNDPKEIFDRFTSVIVFYSVEKSNIDRILARQLR